MKIRFALTPIPMKWSLQKFAYNTIALLSCHVQNSVAVRHPEMELYQNIFHRSKVGRFHRMLKFWEYYRILGNPKMQWSYFYLLWYQQNMMIISHENP